MDTAAKVEQPASSKSKKGISMKENIIYTTKVPENEEEDVVEEEEEEEEEVEEIVEIIEEIVEEEVEDAENVSKTMVNPKISQEVDDHIEKTVCDVTKKQSNNESQGDLGCEDEQNVKSQSLNRQPDRRSYERRKKSAVVTYDADEDWEEEENEQQITESRGTRSGRNNISDSLSSLKRNHLINGKRSTSLRDKHYSTSKKTNTEPVHKAAKTRASMNYSDARNISNSLESEENQEDEEESQQEIVKSTETNLVYTVLGSKKQMSTSAKTKKNRTLSHTQESARYMKMERLDDDTVPIEGTIYYEGDNMETVYVAQPVQDGSEQYQYEGETPEQEEHEWEETNEGASENQEEEEEEDEGVQQDQIFLHEDEDGQLYFKDDSGTLQPVYLTADGNYAIAENSSDEQEVQDSTTNNREATLTPSRPAEVAKSFDDDSFIVPENDSVASSSNPNDPDDADNTVTISLIISEDENGQKRTQVIIPTTDNLKCDLCAKTFKTSFQLLRHNRLKHAREEDITTRNFPCDLCPKRYSDQNTLARHRKTHLGDRPFGCLECGKSFPTSTALRRHLTQHNPQSRPLPCIYCGRRFLEKSALTKHEQSHLAGDQRTHTCDICHKSFLQAADLNLHKKNHDPDKKFDCEVCGREFNRLNNLQRHMMVHKQKQGGNQEILACDVCGITYKFMSSLTRHMVTSHMNPEKLRQQAEEQRKKRENNYRRYLENRKMYETQHSGMDYSGSGKRAGGYRSSNENDEDTA